MALSAHKPSIDTCNACGKLFPRTSMRLCNQCALVEEHRFELVRQFLVDSDGAAVPDIARSTGVSTSDVRRFMESGRLVAESGGTMRVDECTCDIEGQRCRACRAELAAKFQAMESRMADDQRRRGTGTDPGGRARAAEDDASGRTSYVRRIRRIGDS